jgi:hypothetical protein
MITEALYLHAQTLRQVSLSARKPSLRYGKEAYRQQR